MTKFFSYFLALLLSSSRLINGSGLDTSCLTLESPLSGSIITSPSCTLSVRTTCGHVASVRFKATFLKPDRLTDTLINISEVTSPPFKAIWSTESVPNIVYRGLTLSAEALLRNGGRQTVSSQGIFIANKPVDRPLTMIPFSKSQGTPLFSRTISTKRFPVTVQASSSWTDDALHFNVRVSVPMMFSTQSQESLSETGIDVCLDPFLLRHPYPSDSIVMLTIPLNGMPFLSLYKAVWSADGSFNIPFSKSPVSCIYDIRKDDMKGFGVTFSVSRDLLAGSVPDSFGCNILVKIPGDNDHPVRIAWNNMSGTNAYSPFLWGTVRLSPRPIYQYLLVQWLASFIAGLAVAFMAGFGFSLLKKRERTFEQFEQSEEEKKLSDNTYQFIEENITRKDISLHWVAQKLDLQASQIERLIKKYKGKSFKDYIMFLRVEIAKERLRSSHASEKSIAESCGFKNVSEMEKYFSRFCRVTPYRFRKANQVA